MPNFESNKVYLETVSKSSLFLLNKHSWAHQFPFTLVPLRPYAGMVDTFSIRFDNFFN